MTPLETVNTILLMIMSVGVMCYRYKYNQYKDRYLKLKQKMMVHFYGGKTDIMTELADQQGIRVIDIKLTKDINNGT